MATKASNKLEQEIKQLGDLLKYKAKHMSSDQLRAIRKRKSRLTKSLKQYQQMLKNLFKKTGQFTLKM